MGYLTTITIRNDALHDFRKDPANFAEAIFKGIDEANMNYTEVSVGFAGYCNYISVQPSRHADDETVYVHSGNDVFNLNPYGQDFERLQERLPEILEKKIKVAKSIIDSAKKKLKLAKQNKDKPTQ